MLGLLLSAALLMPGARAAEAVVDVKGLSVSGGVDEGKARLVIEALLHGSPADKEKLIFATALQHSVQASRDKLTHTFSVTIDVLQGDPKELPLAIVGEGEVRQVSGEGLQDWSIRRESDGGRTLVLRPRRGDKPVTQLAIAVTTERDLRTWKNPEPLLTLTPPQPALFNGFVKLESAPDLELQPESPSGLFPIEPGYLPAAMQGEAKPEQPAPLAFQFQGSAYALPIRLVAADPESRRVALHDFKLVGAVREQAAAFTLTGTARVTNPKGGALAVLSGGAALTELPEHPDWRVASERGRFVVRFDKPGEFPLQLKFNAAVRQNDGWNSVDFRVAPSALAPIVLQGLAADTQFQFAGAARPERVGEDFVSYLPPDGAVKLSWKSAAPETEGRLFYSAEMLSQISVGSGLMRQTALLDGKVMQGELDRVTVLLRGDGEVTRVSGERVLAWNVEPGADGERRLLVQFNQPQKAGFSFQVQTQTPIGAFPQTVDAVQLRPEGATRFAGHLRVVNDGAVRLEVVQARALSQISPEQFPESDATKAAFHAGGGQRFAYRFSGPDFALRIQADQILPEVAVSEVLSYHHGENELSIEAEVELDIREAPIREALLRTPKGYAAVQVNAAGMSDYFLRDVEGSAGAELRVVFGQPVSGRQILQLRLERNQALGAPNWELPRIEVLKAKSVRGHVAVSADAGFRLNAERTQGLTEIATAFFPRKVAGLQAAFRLSEPGWQATIHAERLPQSVQADAFHLFSIGEGVAYGSSVLTYSVSGAPISAFRVELSDEYFNVEFTGKDIRSWQKTETGYVVQLHTPVSGAYTLLAAYERPFKAQGETLAFTGARPVDAQTEQGYTLVISAYQFQVKPASVSPGLLPLEPAEVPAEHRLFFDAPILAAYRYTARPFDLKLALSPLAQGESLNQVVDRATLATRISKEGQALTDAQYLVKSRGNARFRVALPDAVQLWSATVNGAPATPVSDAGGSLIPLPMQADPNAVLTVNLKLASRSESAARVRVAAPIVSAPVMLAEWKLEPDAGQRLAYRSGALTPAGGVPDASGFAQLARTFSEDHDARVIAAPIVALALSLLTLVVWRGASEEGGFRFGLRFWTALFVGCAALAVALLSLAFLAEHVARRSCDPPRSVAFVAPVQQGGAALWAEVANVEDKATAMDWLRYGWPILPALIACAYGLLARKRPAVMLGWALLAWTALRCPNGGLAFLLVIAAFLVIQIAVPALRGFWRASRKPAAPPRAGEASAVAAAALGAFLWCANSASAQAPAAAPAVAKAAPVAESVSQQIRMEDQFAIATAKIRWQAAKGQRLPLLFEPAVLTGAALPPGALKLVQTATDGRRSQEVLALESGAFDIELQYQVAVTKKEGESGVLLPTQFGLVNRVSVVVANMDVDVISPQAVAVERKADGKNTAASLVLSPVNDIWIAWRPRSRDAAREKALFYAELTQLYAPTAGVIEGIHRALIRPARGELKELVFDAPKGATIVDVTDGSVSAVADQNAPATPLVSQWRFDPDAGKLRVSFASAQSRPFTLDVRSQSATGPLPVSQELGLLSVENAAGQIGLVAIGSGNEVQLESVSAGALSPINLEDFPGGATGALEAQIPGLAVRRAFRYADPKSLLSVKAAAVEPDVRVESQDTASLGEDRVVLAVNATVDITRAGIFRLSFTLPGGMDVESISGQAMSHWTELKTDAGRVITLHLKGRTEGRQQFAVSLAGPGVKSAKGWAAPQVVFREASKQRGTFLVVPEQGMRLQVSAREGVTQLDPQQSGIKQKGVLSFRVLQTPWSLALDVEQVDAWVQVTSLQHAAVAEAQVKVLTNLQYQIENTGLKAFRILLPANAENVRFQGDQVADFLPVPNAATDGLQLWEVKLHRRVLGAYLLQASYQTPLPAQAAEAPLRGVQAVDVNLQRGFVTAQSGGRLQLRVDAQPEALQPAEWQSIPRALQKDLSASSASFAYRLIEPAFLLPLKIERREAAKLLPARVSRVTFTTAASDSGEALTHARLEMIPGDKRLLRFTLPKEARFWFAFVNQNAVWPWREADQILIPLEQQSRTNQQIPVEIFYSSQSGTGGASALDLQLLAPRFDLPLEDITWRVYLNEKWKVTRWTGSLQLQEEASVYSRDAVDVRRYLQNEAAEQREKSKAAERMLALGNSALQRGNPLEARRAFESAWELSQHDSAFNEDARVQLHNLKLQQAVVGLAVRNSDAVGEPDALAGKLRSTKGGKEATYTQQDAKQIMDRNSADENAAFMRVAERLVQQQDAATANPAAIRTSVPEQGRRLTFARSVAVDTWADLRVNLKAEAAPTPSWAVRIAILGATALAIGFLSWFVRPGRATA